MKAVLQRVESASVTVGGTVKGKIGRGYVVLLGVSISDTVKQAERLVEKISGLRIFPDENGKTNLSAREVDGEILVVSQFTLYADCRKGNRPSFTGAGTPQLAKELYEHFIKMCGSRFSKVESGEFGAEMKVQIVNDGPFTLLLEED